MSTTQSHWVAAKRMVALMISLLSVLPAFAEDKNQGLITAASKGHIEEITDLLKRGADVNATNRAGMTPLMMAASRGHLEAVKLLLEKGADVKAESIFLHCPQTGCSRKAFGDCQATLGQERPQCDGQFRVVGFDEGGRVG